MHVRLGKTEKYPSIPLTVKGRDGLTPRDHGLAQERGGVQSAAIERKWEGTGGGGVIRVCACCVATSSILDATPKLGKIARERLCILPQISGTESTSTHHTRVQGTYPARSALAIMGWKIR